jgi:23S rRNA-/tRNA-specific pseudouridylate synthase
VSLAWTKYSVISSNDEYCSLLDIQLLTGFKHQIRVHLADGLGCPILGDYQFAGPLFRKDHLLGRKMDYIAKQRGYTRGPVYLHAYEVSLPSQESGKSLVINASLPDYFVKTLRGLGLELPHKYKSLAKIK